MSSHTLLRLGILYDIQTGDLEDLLHIHAWGRWARPNIEKELGYTVPEIHEIIAFLCRKFPYPSRQAGITDDYGMLMNRIICQLPKEEAAIICHKYIYCMTYRDIAKKMGSNHTRVIRTVTRCLSAIWGSLYLRHEIE